MARRHLELAAILALVATGATATPSPQIEVQAPPALASVAEEVRLLAVEDFSEVLHLTGMTGFTDPIRVMLAPETSQLARDTPRWVSGYARGTENLIVLFPARVRSYPDRNLRALLHHEVAHVLVAQAAGGRPVPRWFNEGVATVAAREWGLEDRARFAAAVIGRGPSTTRELDAAFRGSGDEVRRAYALSAAFIRFMQQRYGSLAPADVLAGLADGFDFETAFARATGDPLRRAEEIFFEEDAFWNTWVPFLTSSGALWMAITALALLAIHRRWVRRRRILEQWEAEEQLAGRIIRREDLEHDTTQPRM